MENKIKVIQAQVTELLSQDQSGHGMEHIERVLALALKFAQQEHANVDLVTIIALLHDADDYKLFGHKSAATLTNARRIMTEAGLNPEIQEQVCDAIQHMGYSKCLQGIRPQTLEGQIVSDADMCDGLGVAGILRTYQYGFAHGRPFFRKELSPAKERTAENYIGSNISDTSIDHFFDKVLLLKSLMLTPSGKHEAKARHDFVVRFLRELFQEENATEWQEYLEDFLTKNGGTDRNCSGAPALPVPVCVKH